MSDETLFKLVNPEFDFEWNGKVYHVKKANLKKVIQYQERAKMLTDEKDPASDLKLSAYCIYLVLIDHDESLTEDFILEHTSGDVDSLELFVKLGFLNPSKVKTMLQTLANNKLTSDDSLSLFQKKQDGHQMKSEV